MDLSTWDQEMRAIAEELQAAEAFLHEERLNGSLNSLKHEILNLQEQLSIVLERIQRAAHRKALLPARQRSILHWSEVMAHKIHHYYFDRVQLKGKTMWLKLLRTRTPGCEFNPDSPFSDEHLIELSVRLQKIQETRQLLLERLFQLNRQKSELHYAYSDFLTRHANLEAAQSLNSRFGNSYAQSLSNPSFRRIKKSVSNIFSYARQQLSGGYAFSKVMQEELDQQSSELVRTCRTMVVDQALSGSKTPLWNSRREFNKLLKQLDQLDEQLSSASLLLKQPPPSPHLKMLKE